MHKGDSVCTKEDEGQLLAHSNHLKDCLQGRTQRRLLIGVLLLGLQGLLVESVPFAAQFPTEYQFKASSLFNLLKFVEWPGGSSADANGKWVIGVAGSTPVTYELVRMVAGKTILGRELKINTVQSPEGMRTCNVLFISASERKRLPSILAALRGYSVLTVSDMDNFVGSGGMVQLVMADDRVRMTIDVGAASYARLKISAKLLGLASAVTARNAE